MMLTMPRAIETQRLYLRIPGPDDVETVFAYASDPVATRFMAWPTAVEVDDSRDFLDDVAAGWAAGDDFCYAVTERGDGCICGAAACQFDAHGAEIGYILAPSFWGRGYATEAAGAIIAAAWKNPDLYRIWATCVLGNEASVRVLEKLGMRYEGRLARWIKCPNLDGDSIPRDAYCYAITR
jgi:ribosomal-protein-alanine N-acetyltransferase